MIECSLILFHLNKYHPLISVKISVRYGTILKASMCILLSSLMHFNRKTKFFMDFLYCKFSLRFTITKLKLNLGFSFANVDYLMKNVCGPGLIEMEGKANNRELLRNVYHVQWHFRKKVFHFRRNARKRQARTNAYIQSFSAQLPRGFPPPDWPTYNSFVFNIHFFYLLQWLFKYSFKRSDLLLSQIYILSDNSNQMLFRRIFVPNRSFSFY